MGAKARWAGLLMLLLVSLAIGGCWDRRELQDRNIVLAVAIDTAEDGQKKGQGEKAAQVETFVQPQGDKRYRFSFQVLRLAKSGGGDIKEAGGRTYVLSNTGQSIFEAVRDMLGQSSKSLYFEHIQAVVISEAAARQSGLKPIIDWFLRDAEMRWRIKLFLTPGEARPIIEYVPPSKELGGLHLANIIRNNPKSVHLAGAKTDLGNVSVMLDNKRDIVIPRVDLVNKVLKVRGAALFKRDKFAGYLDDQGVAGLKYLRGTEKSAIITVPGDKPGEVVLFEMFRHDTRLEPRVEGDNVYFVLDITMWGNIGEYQAADRLVRINDPEFIHKIEVKTAQEVKRIVLYAKDMCQSHGVDILTFGTKLSKEEPKTWAKVKDRWDEIFPYVPLVVSVNVVIEQVGEHK